jgi:hypothetical protein
MKDSAQAERSPTHPSPGLIPMSKNRQSTKEAKKKPTMTLQEKRAAKKSKKESKTFLGEIQTR